MIEYNGKEVVIMCCSTCNTKCDHCYINYKGNIDEEALFSMVKELSKKYIVSLNGTEILLNCGYLKSLLFLKQDRVLTNGLVIHNNPTLIDKIKRNGINWVCMSYHFDLHNIVSKVDKSIIIDNIHVLKENGMNVEIMTTISKINLYSIKSIVEEAIAMNCDCIRFTNYFNSGNAKKLDQNDFVLSDDELNIFFDQFYQAKKLYSDKILVKRSGLFDRDMRKEKSSYYCPAGENAVSITPDMKVYPCPFLVEDGYDIGRYVDGKVLIDPSYHDCYDHSRCLTHSVFNRGMKIGEEND